MKDLEIKKQILEELMSAMDQKIGNDLKSKFAKKEEPSALPLSDESIDLEDSPEEALSESPLHKEENDDEDVARLMELYARLK